MGPEKAGHRGGWSSLPELREETLRHGRRYHDRPAAPARIGRGSASPWRCCPAGRDGRMIADVRKRCDKPPFAGRPALPERCGRRHHRDHARRRHVGGLGDMRVGEWQKEHDRWQRRDLSTRRSVYIWADGNRLHTEDATAIHSVMTGGVMRVENYKPVGIDLPARAEKVEAEKVEAARSRLHDTTQDARAMSAALAKVVNMHTAPGLAHQPYSIHRYDSAPETKPVIRAGAYRWPGRTLRPCRWPTATPRRDASISARPGRGRGSPSWARRATRPASPRARSTPPAPARRRRGSD